ncbi:MAG: PD-(D/E)XK nuclease family protein, partial [Puniceicoccales bacterium]|nr:PD-(D/E)XK nuclease family protein [Puniceicoccales bacterium]
MVKVFLFESPERGLNFARRKLKKKGIWILPSKQMCDIFSQYLPLCKEGRHPFLTPTEFLQTLCRKLNLKERCFPEKYLHFLVQDLDPTEEDPGCLVDTILPTYAHDERVRIEAWFAEKCWITPKIFYQKNISMEGPITDEIVLYGCFREALHETFFKILQKYGSHFTWINFIPAEASLLRYCEEVTRIRDAQVVFQNRKSVYSFPTVHQELLWYQNQTFSNKNAICVGNEKTLQTIASAPHRPSILWAAWIQWMRLGTLDAFCEYVTCLRNHFFLDKILYKGIWQDLQNAVHHCLTHNYAILQTYLLKNKNAWIREFQHVILPEQGLFDEFLEKILPAFKSHAQKTQASETIACVAYPNRMHRDQFFNILRTFLTQEETSNKMFVSLEVALCFPYDRYFISCACHDVWGRRQKDLDDTVLHWEKMGCNVIATYAEQMNAVGGTPLWQATDKLTVSENALDGTRRKIQYRSRARLKLHPASIQLTCKGWERFKLAPWQTWLENILKIHAWIDFQTICDKQKVLGEWTHQCLQFSKTPADFNDWIRCIHGNIHQKLLSLQELYTLGGQPLPYFVRQWMAQLTALCRRLSAACEKFFNASWHMHSEWILPQMEDGLSGRIDLLAFKGTSLTTATCVTVVDYKTSPHFNFTPHQIDQGKGFQLLLYGQQLQKLGISDVTLVVINPVRCQMQTMEALYSSVGNIYCWFRETQLSGVVDV